MYHVIQSCDRAQLVVADLTGNNPNVLYEMAVLDAMGRACVPVKIQTGDEAADESDRVPFDRAAYRVFPIPEDTAEAIRLLKEPIERTIEIQTKGDMFQNPLTDYFEVPLSSFSSAFGLARGYYRNLVRPVFEGILNGGLVRTADDRRDASFLTLDCVIPTDLRMAERRRIDQLVKDERLRPEVMRAPGREVRLYSWAGDGPVRLVDIPTTMVALLETVESRLGRYVQKDPASHDYLEIQEDEVEQFWRYLTAMLRSAEDRWEMERRVKLVRWSDSSLAVGGP
jgi:hypothetical protein